MTTPNILNLPAYSVTGMEETEHDYHVQAETVEPLLYCGHCRTRDLIVGYGRREALVKDLPSHGKRVGIYVQVRRLRCDRCKRVFHEDLPDVDTKRNMTTRLVRWIGQESLRRSFVSVADDCGVDQGTVRSVFKDHVAGLEKTIRFDVPECLGIDEVHLVKRPRAVFANLGQCTLINMLPDRNKRTVAGYLGKLDGSGKIRAVTMDMWVPYRSAVRETLPKARIIVDKFHVLRLANMGLETVRKGLRESLTPKERRGLMHDRFVLLRREKDLTPERREVLESWCRQYPALGGAYRLKESFFAIYAAESRRDAKALYREWLWTWKRSYSTLGFTPIEEAFTPLVTAFENWQDEILAYFDARLTNACTESLNALVKAANRVGRGYSFAAVRAKILFTRGTHKTAARPKFGRKAETGVSLRASVLDRTMGLIEGGDEEINYGVDIVKLVKLIEKGQI